MLDPQARPSQGERISSPAPVLDPKRTALLAPQPGDIVVRKTRVGAVSTPDLDRQLRDRGIDTLVLAGISTSGVVLSTLVEATDRDYRLYVLSDGTEDPDEQTRDVLLGQVFPRRARVIDTATLHTLLSP